MNKVNFIFLVLLFMALPGSAEASYEDALKRTKEIDSTLTSLTAAMEQGEEARAKALAASYGQQYLELDKLSQELAVEEPFRFAVLEDTMRNSTERYLSSLQTIRPFVPKAQRTGIDRSLQVYLNARELASDAVAYTILKETIRHGEQLKERHDDPEAEQG